MPNLPTVSVTQAQADRVLVAFGGTLELAVPAYKDWLVKTVRAYVLDEARRSLEVASAAANQTALGNINADLPPEPPLGPML